MKDLTIEEMKAFLKFKTNKYCQGGYEDEFYGDLDDMLIEAKFEFIEELEEWVGAGKPDFETFFK